MMQLRYLQECTLNVLSSVKQANGTYRKVPTLVDTYKVQMEELSDQVSSSIYGANMLKTYRLISPYHKLENYLIDKTGCEGDNISKYQISINDYNYKIVAVKRNWIDIELL